MGEDLKTLSANLDDIARAVGRIEQQMADAKGAVGTEPDSRWQYLIARPHPWRRQLCIKGRNMTVGQLVSSIRANRLAPEEAAERLDLPLPAIYEALIYFAENRGLIDLEATEERRQLAERGLALEPEDLSR